MASPIWATALSKALDNWAFWSIIALLAVLLGMPFSNFKTLGNTTGGMPKVLRGLSGLSSVGCLLPLSAKAPRLCTNQNSNSMYRKRRSMVMGCLFLSLYLLSYFIDLTLYISKILQFVFQILPVRLRIIDSHLKSQLIYCIFHIFLKICE